MSPTLDLAVDPRFHLAELTRTDHPDLQDAPGVEVLFNLQRLVADVLRPARDSLGVPLRIASGYRSPRLNAAVGGSPTSAHVLGLAADVVPEGLDIVEAYRRLRASGLAVDQAILEEKASRGGQTRWLHLGLAPKRKAPRGEWLAFTPKTHGHYLPFSEEVV